MKPSKILSFLLFLPTVAMFGCTVASQSSPAGQDKDLATVASYRKWTLVNPTPQLMEPLAALSCAIIPGRQEGSPHLHKYINVFVNPVGREAMMSKQTPKFPVGSMIVKEKHGSVESMMPEVLTVMIKREAGYNPESGDWEYLVLDGAASRIVERGKLTRCSSCNVVYERRDFVSRTYILRDVVQELKP